MVTPHRRISVPGPKRQLTRFAAPALRIGGLAALLLGPSACDPSTDSDPVAAEGDAPVASADYFVSAQKTSVPGTARFDLYFTQPGTSHSAAVDPVLDDDLIALVTSATTRVDVAMYDWNRQNVIDAFVAARARGVSVRMVGDGDNTQQPGYVQVAAAGVPIVNRPAGDAIMHDKFVVIDGRYVWGGSTNATTANMVYDNNNAVIIESPGLAAAYTAEFEEMWTVRHFGPAKADVNASAHTVSVNGVAVDYWFAPKEQLMAQLVSRVASAQRSVRFLAFTFARPDLRDALIARHAAGVKVFGVFDALQANGKDSQDEALASAGVPTFLDGNTHAFGAGNMHHKVMIIDGETEHPLVVTGSFNFTTAADTQNDENQLVFHDGALARAYLAEFCTIWGTATKHPLYVGAEDPGCAGKLLINEALPNPTGTDTGSEYVEIANVGLGDLDLSGFQLLVGSTVRHVFPAGYTLPSLGVGVVYDSGTHPGTPGATLASTHGLALPNTTGTITLKTAAGGVVDSFAYGAPTSGVAMNRSPDLQPLAPVAPHASVAGASGPISPGKRVDQAAFAATAILVAPTTPPPLPRELLITQLATRGATSSSDDFVEVYNASGHTVDVSGVKLQYETASCASWTDRHTVANTTHLAPGQFFLIAHGTGYVAPASGPVSDGKLSATLADNGLVRLVDAGGVLLDEVAYGTGLACTGSGNTVAPNHGTTANTRSLARKPFDAGTIYSKLVPVQDTANNAADFAVRGARLPRNASTTPAPSH